MKGLMHSVPPDGNVGRYLGTIGSLSHKSHPQGVRSKDKNTFNMKFVSLASALTILLQAADVTADGNETFPTAFFNETIPGSAECSANEACVGLADNCCPTLDDIFLCTFDLIAV
jgi:hypothetical protein